MPVGLSVALQTFLVFLSATMLGGIHGTAAVGLWFIIGSLGLNVLTEGSGGLEAIKGPFAGYIWSYFILSFISGIGVGTPHLFEKRFNLGIWIKIAVVTIISYILVDIAGLLAYRSYMLSDPSSLVYSSSVQMTQKEIWILIAGKTCLSSIPYTVVLCIASIPISASLRAYVAKLLYPSDEIMEEEMLEEIKRKQERIDRIFSRRKRT